MFLGSRVNPLTGYRQAITDSGEPASDMQPVLFYVEPKPEFSTKWVGVNWNVISLHEIDLVVTKTCRLVQLVDDEGHVLAISDIGRTTRGTTLHLYTNWEKAYE